MPTCAKCNKKTFDGTRWNSTTFGKEYSGKYLCRSCYQEIEKEQTAYNQTLYVQNQEFQIESQKMMLNDEIEATKQKLEKLEGMKANNDLKGYSETKGKETHVVTGSENLYGIVSIILALVSLFFFGSIFGGAAIVCGYIGYRRNDKKGVIGMVIGAIALLLSVMVLLGNILLHS